MGFLFGESLASNEPFTSSLSVSGMSLYEGPHHPLSRFWGSASGSDSERPTIVPPEVLSGLNVRAERALFFPVV